MKLTEWYPGEVKPVRVGVYQRDRHFTGTLVYSRWDGEFWCQYHVDKKSAATKKHASMYQNLQWRGVAK